MASEIFNTLGGYSVGIPGITVIDGTGNVVTNVLTTGNVTAGNIYADVFRYANGTPLGIAAAGSNTQVQFNSNGAFGSSSNFTFDSAANVLTVSNAVITDSINLGDASNITILGGNNGYVLVTDGTGNLSWSAAGGSGNGAPGGTNAQVQFNDNGLFGADTSFTFNSTTNLLTIENLSTTGITNLNSVSNVKISGGTSGYFLQTDGFGNLNWAAGGGGGGNGTPGGTNTQVQFNDNGLFGADAELVYDKVTNTLSTGNLSVSTSIATTNGTFNGNLAVNGVLTTNTSSTLRVLGNLNAAASGNVNLGPVGNIHIAGGLNGHVLSTDGGGNLSWVEGGGGGGNGTPGGSNTQIQFNKNGSFAGSPYLTFNDYTNIFQVGGNLIANSTQIGAGFYKFCTSQVYFAITTSNVPGQLLFSIPTADISGVEFHIIGTDPAGPSRQSVKISSLVLGTSVQFTEYAGMYINGGVGNFEVDYDAGTIIAPPSLQLKISPNTSDSITYRMLITTFAG